MRKKILSVALALCMVLGMLPTTFASVATDLGYTDDQIAMTITEDTTITENQDGLVLVVSTAKVTVTNARISIAIVVAPGAKDSQIIIADEADVNAIIILDTAELTVEEGATAAFVTVSAPETKAEIAGTVTTVTVDDAAEKAEVIITETAAVSAVQVAAPEAKTEIAGEVATVTVAETAAGAAIAVTETAAVSAVQVAAPEAKTEIAGEVASVTVAETAAGAATTITGSGSVDTVAVAAPEAKTEIAGTVTTVTVDETAAGAATTVTGSGSVDTVAVAAPDTTTTVNGTVNTVDVADTATGTTVNGTNAADVEITGSTENATVTPSTTDVPTSLNNPGIIAAPLGDWSKGNIVYAPGYGVSVSGSGSNLTATITGTIPQHTSSDDDDFVGIAIPVLDNDTVTYEYYYIKTTIETDKTLGEVVRTYEIGKLDLGGESITKDEMIAQGITNATAEEYNTFYFTEETAKAIKAGGIDYEIVVVDSEAEVPELDGENGTLSGTDEHVTETIDALRGAASLTINVEVSAELKDAEDTVKYVENTEEDADDPLKVADNNPTPSAKSPVITAPEGVEIPSDIVDLVVTPAEEDEKGENVDNENKDNVQNQGGSDEE